VKHKGFMKNPVIYLLSAIVLMLNVIVLSSCSDKSSKTELLTSKIQYDVLVSNNDPQLDWWINNIEGSRREPFLKRIMEAAETGQVRAFDYFNNPLTPAQVESVGTDTIYQSLLRTTPPYEEYDTMIISTISYRDIVKIRFMEEWKWNPSSLEIEKKVLAIGPVLQKTYAGENYNQLLFWISVDQQFPGK
jgi:hypothetical protein